MKVTVVPIQPGEGGYYEQSLVSGAITGTSATNPVFSFRWSNTDYDMILLRLLIRILTTTAFGAAQLVDFAGFFARAFTGSDSGGTTSVPTAAMQKLKTSHPNSRFVTAGDIRIATTGTLTAGTRTLDTFPLFSGGFWSAAIGNGIITPPFVYPNKDDGLPFPRFKTNEGLVITLPTALGATGVIKAWIDMGWMEVKSDYILED